MTMRNAILALCGAAVAIGLAARRLPPLAFLFGLATCAALTLLPVEAQAACRGGFCVSGSDVGPNHVVNFTTTWNKNISHYDVAYPDGEQQELGRNQTQFVFLNGPSGKLEQFGLQACSGGGFMEKSNCSPWAYFTHTPQ